MTPWRSRTPRPPAAAPTSTGAVNTTRTTLTDYGIDPRGLALFTGLSAFLQRGISGHVGTMYTGDRGDPGRTYNGDIGAPVQHFTGAAALALYGASHPAPSATDLARSFSQDVLNDPALRIFAARARREQLTGTGL